MKNYLEFMFPMYLFCPWMLVMLPVVAMFDPSLDKKVDHG